MLTIVATKACCTCKTDMPLDMFSKNRSSASGLQDRCKECFRSSSRAFRENDLEYAAAAQKKWRRNNPEVAAVHRRRSRYGLSDEGYREMLRTQAGMCAICSLEMERPCVDHDHVTGIVRGLLCRACNLGLGHFRDDPDRIARAIAYLTE